MMPFPQYRSRYLPSLTMREIEEIPNKETVPVILPIGAVEQHGPHLPVGVDSLIGQARLNYTLPKLPDTCSLWVAPPIQVGKSNEHIGFPGTLSISKETLRKKIITVCLQLKEWGFRCVLMLNTHGGNIQVLRYTARELMERENLDIRFPDIQSGLAIPPQEEAYGFHAGLIETSIMLEIMNGERIQMDRAECEFPAKLEDPGELRPECAPAIYSWISADVSASGIMGDAKSATPEFGAAWMAGEANSFLDSLIRICEELGQT